MRTNREQYLKKQRGAAAIWMGLLLVPILGAVIWAVEGTRYVQETNRLRDAAEASALAVTIADGGENQAKLMTEKYLEYYVRDIQAQDLKILPKHQPLDTVNDVREYIEYRVDAKTTHNSWFVTNFIPSFDQQEQLAGFSVARKYVRQEEIDPVDIVFVADFSGSMNETFGASGIDKIDALKKAIDQMSIKYLCVTPRYENEQYFCDNKNETGLNQIGFVPFALHTMESLDGQTETNSDGSVELVNPRATSQLVYFNKRADEFESVSQFGYNDIDWDIWTKFEQTDVFNCANGGVCNIGAYSEADAAEYAKRIQDIRNSINVSYRQHTLDAPDYIDYESTVDDMFTNKWRNKQNFFSREGLELIDDYYVTGFRNIELTNSLPKLNDIQKMPVRGGTAAYQGILRGLQVLNAGAPDSTASENEREVYQNKKQLLLVFTDGEENQGEVLINLVNKGKMCDRAREKFPNLLIAVIGIAHDANNMKGYQDCVIDKDEDIIKVNNVDDLINRIDNLILRGLRGYEETKLY